MPTPAEIAAEIDRMYKIRDAKFEDQAHRERCYALINALQWLRGREGWFKPSDCFSPELVKQS